MSGTVRLSSAERGRISRPEKDYAAAAFSRRRRNQLESTDKPIFILKETVYSGLSSVRFNAVYMPCLQGMFPALDNSSI
jgi:hypothetical protein